MDKQTLDNVFKAQKNEITEYHIYNKIAVRTKDRDNKEVLHKIANEEKAHYDYFSKHSGQQLKPSRWQIFKFYWIIRIFGLTFGLKLMEHSDRP